MVVLPLKDQEAVADLAPGSSLEAPWPDAPITGALEHRFGLYEGGRCLSAGRLALRARPRWRHVGDLALRGQPDLGLLTQLVRFADEWTPTDRLNLVLEEGSGWLEPAVALGFRVESRRVERLPGVTELVLGRLRPGFVLRPPGGPPPWPSPGHRRVRDWAVLPLSWGDLPAVARGSVQPTVVWGTLQSPTSNEAFYLDRHRNSPPGDEAFGLHAEGELAGCGNLHALPFPGAVVLGMALFEGFQGSGGGRALLDALLRRARERGLRRVELQVWEDNTRARALYQSRGFVEEGVLRADGWRAGGHASSLEMALVLPDAQLSG